jgi:hypothetical protein
MFCIMHVALQELRNHSNVGYGRAVNPEPKGQVEQTEAEKHV